MTLSIVSPGDIGHCVRRERARRGWSQQDLANRVGVSRTFVSQLESGKPTVELSLVLRVMHALGVQLTADTEDRHTTQRSDIDLDQILDRLGSVDG